MAKRKTMKPILAWGFFDEDGELTGSFPNRAMARRVVADCPECSIRRIRITGVRRSNGRRNG